MGLIDETELGNAIANGLGSKIAVEGDKFRSQASAIIVDAARSLLEGQQIHSIVNVKGVVVDLKVYLEPKT